MPVCPVSVSHCKEVAIVLLVILDKILVLIWLVRVVGIVALSRPVAPPQHLIGLVDGLGQRRALGLV